LVIHDDVNDIKERKAVMIPWEGDHNAWHGIANRRSDMMALPSGTHVFGSSKRETLGYLELSTTKVVPGVN
jgi:hypothetical protein